MVLCFFQTVRVLAEASASCDRILKQVAVHAERGSRQMVIVNTEETEQFSSRPQRRSF